MSARYGFRNDRKERGDRFERDESRMDQLRVPPHSIEAEQAVLGGLMLEPRALHQVADLLTDGDFYRRDHALIWRAVKTLADARKPIDVVTVGDWIESQGLAEQVAGGAYLIELANNTPSAANIRAYAVSVREKGQRRRLIEVGTSIVGAGFQADGRDVAELIGEAQTRVGSLLADEPCDLEPLAPVMLRVHERLTERHALDGGARGLSTGLPELDDLLNGLQPGGLYVLAARPKMGKTTLAQNIAEHCALRARQPVAVFSFEMQPDELGDRMLASIGNVDSARIRSGELEDADWTNVTAAMQKLRGAEIFISRPRNARVEHVTAQVRRQHSRKPLGLVVIDYLQLMHYSGDNASQGIGQITRALKLLAGELQIPILLLSQLNRKLEDRPNKRPMPSDLRDSGSIEQDADAVIFIYRDEVYDRTSRYKGTAEILVPLQRSGPPGEVRVLYQPNYFRFSSLPDYWQPEAPPKDEDKPARRGFRKPAGAARDVTGANE